MSALKILERSVVQSNPLIEARKKMSVTELRLFILGLQDIKPHIKDENVHDLEFPETLIPHNDLVELFGNKNNGNINNLKKQIKKAYNGCIELSYKHGGFGFRHIYRKMDYIPQTGLLIQFDDEIKEHILEILNQAYTTYKVKTLFPLSSEYAWRLLELMLEKQGHFKDNEEVFRLMSIEEIRFSFNISDDLYSGRMDNFKKYVIANPIKEINEKTDYIIRYETLREGNKKIKGFKFYMKYKEVVKLKEKEKPAPALPAPPVEEKPTPAPAPVLSPAPMSDRDELKQAMKGEGLKDASINTWLKRYGVEGAAASWQLAVEHASNRTGVQTKSPSRIAYLKHCMDQNIAYTNSIEAELKAEIDTREKEKAEEKKQAEKAMKEGFEKIGFTSDRYGSDLQSTGSIMGVDEEPLEPQKLTKEKLETLIEIAQTVGLESDSFKNAIHNLGYNSRTLFSKYGSKFIGKLYRR